MRADENVRSKFTPIAKRLRRHSTDAENVLWKQLRQRQLGGLKFRRQQPIDDFVVDFVCFEKGIVVEVDGGQHAVELEKDTERSDYLTKNGFKILRFWNNEVLSNMEGVIEVIRRNCQ